MPTRRRSRSRLQRDLDLSTADGSAFGAAVGIGESYLPAFVLAIGGGHVLAGLVATLPMVAGAVFQLGAPAAIRRVGSLKRWVVLCAAIQSLSFVPLVVMALAGNVQVGLVFLVAAVYWASGMSTGPAWNTWIASIVPGRIRAHYFAWRSRAAQFSVFLGLLAGGALLQFGAHHQRAMFAFATLFSLAACFRMASTLLLGRQSAPVCESLQLTRVSLSDLARRMRGGQDARLLMYMLSVTLATQVAAAFFTPYMLGVLHFAYAQYMLLLAVSYAAKIVAMPALGRFARAYGAHRLLVIGGLLIVPMAGFWVVSDRYWFLLAIQLAGGVAWGAQELGVLLLLFETIRDDERTSMLTTFNFLNAVVLAAGSLIGATVLGLLTEGAGAFLAVFLLSTALRVLTVPLLWRLKPSREPVVPMPIRVLAVRPAGGSIQRPVIAGLPPDAARVDRESYTGEAYP